MAAIDFPNSPTEGDTHTVGDRTWKYTGGVWKIQSSIGGALVNIDGGLPGSVYGGVPTLDGGGP